MEFGLLAEALGFQDEALLTRCKSCRWADWMAGVERGGRGGRVERGKGEEEDREAGKVNLCTGWVEGSGSLRLGGAVAKMERHWWVGSGSSKSHRGSIVKSSVVGGGVGGGGVVGGGVAGSGRREVLR